MGGLSIGFEVGELLLNAPFKDGALEASSLVALLLHDIVEAVEETGH